MWALNSTVTVLYFLNVGILEIGHMFVRCLDRIKTPSPRRFACLIQRFSEFNWESHAVLEYRNSIMPQAFEQESVSYSMRSF